MQADLTFVMHQLARVLQNLHTEPCNCEICSERLRSVNRPQILQVESVCNTPDSRNSSVYMEEQVAPQLAVDTDPIDEFIAVTVVKTEEESPVQSVTEKKKLKERRKVSRNVILPVENEPAELKSVCNDADSEIVVEEENFRPVSIRDVTNVSMSGKETKNARMAESKNSTKRVKRNWVRDPTQKQSKKKPKRKSCIFTPLSKLRANERKRKLDKMAENDQKTIESLSSSAESVQIDHGGYVSNTEKKNVKTSRSAKSKVAAENSPPIVITVTNFCPKLQLSPSLIPGFKPTVILQRLDPLLLDYIEKNGHCTLEEFADSIDETSAVLRGLLDSPAKNRLLMNSRLDPLFSHETALNSTFNPLPIVSFSPVTDEDVVEKNVNSSIQEIFECLNRSLDEVCDGQEASIGSFESQIGRVQSAELHESSDCGPQLDKPVLVQIDRQHSNKGESKEKESIPFPCHMNPKNPIVMDPEINLAVGDEVEVVINSYSGQSVSADIQWVEESNDMYAGLTPLSEAQSHVVNQMKSFPLKATEDGFQLNRQILDK